MKMKKMQNTCSNKTGHPLKQVLTHKNLRNYIKTHQIFLLEISKLVLLYPNIH